MVAHFTLRTYGVNQEFRFDEGIWLHQKSGQIRFFFEKYLFLHHACATCSKQPSYIKTMVYIVYRTFRRTEVVHGTGQKQSGLHGRQNLYKGANVFFQNLPFFLSFTINHIYQLY